MRKAAESACDSLVEVVGVGAATLDELWLVPQFSAHEDVVRASAHITMGGGPVATALCVTACLGRSSALIDSLGDDPAAEVLLKELHSHGVRTEWMRRTPRSSTALASILVRKGDGARQIIYLPSSAPEPELSEAARDLVATARILHINGRHERTAREAVAIASQSRTLISFDGGAGRYQDSLRDLVEASHLRILSAGFARDYTGMTDVRRMLVELSRPPASAVVVTEGALGSHALLADGRIHHQPAVHAGRTVDTTGCGDVYHGAFIHQWLNEADIVSAMAYAAELAGMNATGLGGRHVCSSL